MVLARGRRVGYRKDPKTMDATLISVLTRNLYRRLPGIPFGASKADTLSSSLRTLTRNFLILFFVLVPATSYPCLDDGCKRVKYFIIVIPPPLVYFPELYREPVKRIFRGVTHRSNPLFSDNVTVLSGVDFHPDPLPAILHQSGQQALRLLGDLLGHSVCMKHEV